MTFPNMPAYDSDHWELTWGKAVHEAHAGVTLPTPATAPTTTLLWDGTNGGTADTYGRKKVNSAQWTYDLGGLETPIGSGNRGGNWESQIYTDSLQNCYVKDGVLNIVAWRQNGTTSPVGGELPGNFTSARIHTQGKVTVPVGAYVECRLKAPATPAVWSAFWMMGNNYSRAADHTSNWPTSGEADIYEALGQQPWLAGSALHMHETGNGNVNANKPIGWDVPGAVVEMDAPINRWHYYGCWRSATEIRFYVDRVEHLRYTSAEAAASGRDWPFNQGMFVLLNLAVGGLAAGVDGGDSVAGAMPNTMQVEPIKIWNGGVPF